ncbi:phage major capsid protein [[Mycobacterium] nativiensis]|uniref:Phage major capsid protein n=1 Tax=[Mycobacterium] nativiensis TaxID=2855503 RepID=A0ABU5XWC7_9MYCO|nr:phage major capsid protein [Mycolicibacter sp. MYC340]MEB3032289.1 phage major capsid protein [Mycolicibacter sp. MYC340]
MTSFITNNSPKGWAMDVQGIAPEAVIPQALILQCTTKGGEVQGDAPVVRVPRIKIIDAGFVPEGNDIPESDPELSEQLIKTGTVAELLKVSRDQLVQNSAASLISHEMRRSLIHKSDTAFLSQPAPTAPAEFPPGGLLSYATDAGPLTGDLDALVDAFAEIEALPGGVVTHVLAHPSAYATLRQIKKATGSNEALLGAGTQAGEKSILGVPVLTTNAMPSDKIMALDKNYIVSAYSNLELARSDDFYFNSISVALRASFRFGAGLLESEAAQVLTVS